MRPVHQAPPHRRATEAGSRPKRPGVRFAPNTPPPTFAAPTSAAPRSWPEARHNPVSLDWPPEEFRARSWDSAEPRATAGPEAAEAPNRRRPAAGPVDLFA